MSDSNREYIDEVFGHSAIPGDIVKPSSSIMATGWPLIKPPRRNFTWFWNKATSMLRSSEQNGIFPWKLEVSYSLNGICLASDGMLYRSLISNNAGNDPVSSPSSWKNLFEASYDFKYVTLTGGTLPLTGTLNGDYIFNISQFSGPEVDSSNIRKLHLKLTFGGINTPRYFNIEFPDGITHTVYENIDDLDANLTSLIEVPINPNQSTFRINLANMGYGSGFTIIGATQRTFA